MLTYKADRKEPSYRPAHGSADKGPLEATAVLHSTHSTSLHSPLHTLHSTPLHRRRPQARHLAVGRRRHTLPANCDGDNGAAGVTPAAHPCRGTSDGCARPTGRRIRREPTTAVPQWYTQLDDRGQGRRPSLVQRGCIVSVC